MVACKPGEVVTSERFLLVRCGTSCFGLPMNRVRRVLRSLRTFPVPGSRRELVGLLQHDGEPLAVLDLGALVDDATTSSGIGLTVIVSVGSAENAETVGMAVHDAVSVLRIDSDLISDSDNDVVRGEVVVEGELIQIIDPAALSGQST